MIPEQDERALVQGLRKDDRDSLAAVYDAYGAIAFGLALKLLGSRTEAEDVVQESFLALWRQAERIDPARGLRSYLLSIVHNRAIDRIRRRARRPEAELDLEAPIPAATDDPAEEVLRITEGEAVRAALVSLPVDQRQTVELVYFRGLTINETANRMRVPLGTAKSRLRLALGRLRQELETS
jgi:RNA polymerase sigma-70 factor (ECF subfamily)